MSDLTICTSGCDYSSVQAAIGGTVAQSPGTTIELRAPELGGASTFTEGAIVWSANAAGESGNPVTLRGRASDSITIDANLGTIGLTIGRSYVAVENLAFDGAAPSGGTRNILLTAGTGRVLSDITAYGGSISVRDDSGTQDVFNGIHLSDYIATGIYVAGGSGVDIEDVVATGGNTSCLWLSGHTSPNINNVNLNSNGVSGAIPLRVETCASPIVSNAVVRGAAGTKVNVNISGCSNPEVENLTVYGASEYTGTAVYVPTHTGMFSASNVVVDGVCGRSFQVSPTVAASVDIDGFDLSGHTGTGLHITGEFLPSSSVKNGVSIGGTFPFFVSGSGLSYFSVTARDATHIDAATGGGFSIFTGSSGILYDGCIATGNAWDGFGCDSGCSDIAYWRIESCFNGSILDPAAGDGATDHGSTGLLYAYSYIHDNRNSAFAFVGASSGEIYHATCVNNHQEGSVRGALYFGNDSGESWVIKNCIIAEYNHAETDAYSGILMMVGAGGSIPTCDYNIYYSSGNATPFWVHNGGTSGTIADYDKYDFAGWKTYSGQDSHSIFADPLVGADGRTNYLSLAANTGVVIAGINDGGELDLWGNPATSYPNIGADQGAAANYGPWSTCDGILPLSAQPCKSHALPIGVGKITIFDGVASAGQIEEAK